MSMILFPAVAALLAGAPSEPPSEASAPAPTSVRTLTLEDAEQLLIRDNALVLATGSRARGAHETAASVADRMLPSLHISHEYQH
jgi:hypothetical protein